MYTIHSLYRKHIRIFLVGQLVLHFSLLLFVAGHSLALSFNLIHVNLTKRHGHYVHILNDYIVDDVQVCHESTKIV